MSRRPPAARWLGIQPGASNPSAAAPAATYTLSGSVADGFAAALEGVTITLTGDASDSTTTDASGDWSFTVEDGSYTVTPTKSGYQFVPTSASPTVSGGNEVVSAFRADQGLPLSLDFEATTIGQVPAGWVKSDNRDNAATAIAQRNDSGSKEYTDYAKAVHIDADASFSLAYDLGKSLPEAGFKIEIGFVSENASQPPNPYMWFAFGNGLPWTALTDGIQAGIEGGNNRTTINFRKDSSNDANTQAEAVSNDTWRECSKARMEYTKADDDVKCDWTQADAGVAITQTEAYTTEFDDAIVFSWITFWGAANSGTLADFDVVYVWIGSLTDAWPTIAYGAP